MPILIKKLRTIFSYNKKSIARGEKTTSSLGYPAKELVVQKNEGRKITSSSFLLSSSLLLSSFLLAYLSRSVEMNVEIFEVYSPNMGENTELLST